MKFWKRSGRKDLEEIVLHPGLHKTGTTSIQETLFLAANAELLSRRGYMYARCWRRNHSVPIFSAFCDQPEKFQYNIQQRYTREDVERVNAKHLADLRDQVEESPQRRLVISGERASLLTVENLAGLRQYLESLSTGRARIRVPIYVRDPVTRVVSASQEGVKSHVYEAALASAKNVSVNLHRERVGKFIEVFGEDRVEVHAFENALEYERGPVGHFLAHLGFGPDEIKRFKVRSSNESMSALAAEIMSYVNAREPMLKNGTLNETRSRADFNPILKIRGPKFDVPVALKEEVRRIAKDDLDWLDRKFGIDYSGTPIKARSQDYQFTDEIIESIRSAHQDLPDNLQVLLIEFLEGKSGDDPKLVSLIGDLKSPTG